MRFAEVDSFDQWRAEARRLLALDVPPADVHWSTASAQPSLFDDAPAEASHRPHRSVSTPSPAFTVPPAFLELAREVACHRDPIRWQVLYSVLWRLLHGERALLKVTVDNDVLRLTRMRKEVTRDVHKMKAFVRFRKVTDGDGEESYVAWHRPDHQIVRLAAPFFSRRFPAMHWSILTPDESVRWDQRELHYGPGVPVSEAPNADALEEVWKTYYASIFNPARLKVRAMKREMPVRHWATLPEAGLIEELLREAPKRVGEMIERTEGFEQTAMHYMPAELDLASLRMAANCCTACPLHGPATQTVFGEGGENARLMIVGEQPGDQEDVAGKPFIGPAGQLLDEILGRAGIARHDVYVTNVVKHFKYVATDSPGASSRGTHRLHQKPNSREIFACRPWLEAEIATIRPEAMVCLGVTAAQALFGRDFRMTQQRGEVLPTEWCANTMATWHPAAILRMPDPARRDQMREQLAGDLRFLWSMLDRPPSSELPPASSH
ncbi:UdgX family uracil-DNA binding protein [Candidatus Laterigemmans baculatus]|uniref:UdgX family uracil-DNA binding protein n=1 Tax=Candidatus Laterigemmans baculatus TaxID=2770505 RepID=UPI0013DC2041|nr:UdgX family uracil-DNA binding protein [Candidatus Laterigemmans baculatus]